MLKRVCEKSKASLESSTPASALASIRNPLHARIAELEGVLNLAWNYAQEEIHETWDQPAQEAEKAIKAALSHTTAQSLAAHDAEVRRKVLLEAADKMSRKIIGNGEYFSGLQCGIDTCVDDLRDMADARGGE